MTTVVHCKKSKYDVYIGRPSEYGNPFTHKKDQKTLAHQVVSSKYEAIKKYRDYLVEHPEKIEDILDLKGKVLGCWCCVKLSIGKSSIRHMHCHGEVIAALCNSNARTIHDCIEFLKNL